MVKSKANYHKNRLKVAGLILVLGTAFNYETISATLISDWGTMKANLARLTHSDQGTKLNYKPHKQEHSLSCEIASLKVALSVHNIDVSESELLKYLKFDPTPRRGGVWGDPDKGFVGKIDGRMGQTGYGVHWDPIAELAQRWQNSEVVHNVTASELAQYIDDGNPVITWGYYGRGKKLTWTTPEGKRINAIDGEHVRVVIGYEGDSSMPIGFNVFDPIYGEMYWSRDEFMRNWDSFGRTGVVIDN